MQELKKVGGVIVSHGQVANELLVAAEQVVGELSNLAAVSIGWHDEVEVAREAIERAIKQVSQGAGIIIFTDMFGGTPTNISAMFLKDKSVEIITGVNLPMVIKLATSSGGVDLAELAREIEEQGKSAICRAGGLLQPQKMSKDA